MTRASRIGIVGSIAALARLRAGDPFDVVLCDMLMPQLTGMDLFEAIRDAAWPADSCS